MNDGEFINQGEDCVFVYSTQYLFSLFLSRIVAPEWWKVFFKRLSSVL